MSNVVNFTNYNAATEILSSQPAADTYGNLSLALESNPGWSVIEGGKIVVEPATGTSKVVPLSNYIKTEAELTGGVVGATEAVEVAETGVVAGEVTAGTSGILAGWTIGTAVAGILAGTGIGIAAYDLAPEFWVGISNRIFPGQDINYEDIKDYTLIGLIKEEIFGLKSQNTTYLSEKMAQEILDYCAEEGIFSPIQHYCVNDDLPDSYFNYPEYVNTNWFFTINEIPPFNWNGIKHYVCEGDEPVYMFLCSSNAEGRYSYFVYALSKAPFTGGPGQEMNFTNNLGEYIYMKGNHFIWGDGVLQNVNFNIVPVDLDYNSNFWGNDISILLYHGYIGSEGSYSGTYELPDSPQIYNPNGLPLPQQYPQWIGDRRIETHGLEYPADEPSLYPIPWIPVKMPEADPMKNPEKYPSPGQQPEPGIDPEPENQPDAQKGRLPDNLPIPISWPDPTDWPRKVPTEDTPDPTDPIAPTDPTPTPPIVFPPIGGEANALFTVYNPVVSELNSLAGVLWSSDFLVNLMKIFTNNPMDAVISLHMLYATPHIGGRKNIKLGYLDTGISSDYVDKQYIQIDCGTVRIPEYFGDARDYVNSVVDIYLPFIGMRHLKTQDIVGSYVNIKAGVDVFTGTVLYTISIRKTSGINQVMYAFEGNCAIALPLTGADKSRMFSVLGAAATGGAIGGMAGAAVGTFASVMNGSQQADIQRSGNFGANAGAMGVKKPYIVVSRNIGYDANNYSYFHGYPANKTVRIGSCSGYTRVLDCRVDGISSATDTEKSMILDALKRGVIV